jgi:hypothetical protein
MKNLINITETEKNRILEMHKNAIKCHLLSEQPEEKFDTPYNKNLMRSTHSINTGKQIPMANTDEPKDINPKKLKIGDGGKNNKNLKNDVIILQQKLIDLGCLKGVGKPTGYFGNMTKSALDLYNKQGYCGTKKPKKIGNTYSDSENLLKPVNKGHIKRIIPDSTEGFVVTISFPTYRPKIDGNTTFDKMVGTVTRFLTTNPYEIIVKGDRPWDMNDKTYGKLGHGGVATINNKGNVELFEFGRYGLSKKGGYGSVVSKNLGKIAKISDGVVTNIEEVVRKIKSRTESEGPKLPMDWVLAKAPKINDGISYAKSVKEKDYSAADFSISNDAANCGTFALEVVKSSGINIPDTCFPTPRMMNREMKIFGIESGSV